MSMSFWFENYILQKFSIAGYKGKERLDILHEMIIRSEKVITIYRRLPQNTQNKVKSFMLFNAFLVKWVEWIIWNISAESQLYKYYLYKYRSTCSLKKTTHGIFNVKWKYYSTNVRFRLLMAIIHHLFYKNQKLHTLEFWLVFTLYMVWPIAVYKKK